MVGLFLRPTGRAVLSIKNRSLTSQRMGAAQGVRTLLARKTVSGSIYRPLHPVFALMVIARFSIWQPVGFFYIGQRLNRWKGDISGRSRRVGHVELFQASPAAGTIVFRPLRALLEHY